MTEQGRERRRILRRAASVLVVDVTPLRASRRFRWLFAGQACGQLSRQLLVLAVPYHVFVLTGSSLMVGLVGVAQFVPTILASLFGGVVADSLDRRWVLAASYFALSLTTLGLALNSIGAATLWPIFLLAAVNAGAMGVGSPTRTAIVPSVVARAALPSAFALNQSMHQTAQIVVPAFGGLLIAQSGVIAVYWIATVANVIATVAILPLGPQRPAGDTTVSFAALGEGWRYMKEAPLLKQLMVIDLNAMVFGMPRALFPELGLEVFGGGAEAVGLLHAAPGIGALIGALTTGWVSRVRRQGRAVVYAVMVWGISITIMGFMTSLVLALVLLAIAGAADVIGNVFRNAVFQLALPDQYRGRLTSFSSALSTGGPHLGDAESGAVAAITTPRFSIVSGGVLSILGTVAIALWDGRRGLWHQVDEEPDRV